MDTYKTDMFKQCIFSKSNIYIFETYFENQGFCSTHIPAFLPVIVKRQEALKTP